MANLLCAASPVLSVPWASPACCNARDRRQPRQGTCRCLHTPLVPLLVPCRHTVAPPVAAASPSSRHVRAIGSCAPSERGGPGVGLARVSRLSTWDVCDSVSIIPQTARQFTWVPAPSDGPGHLSTVGTCRRGRVPVCSPASGPHAPVGTTSGHAKNPYPKSNRVTPTTARARGGVPELCGFIHERI